MVDVVVGAGGGGVVIAFGWVAGAKAGVVCGLAAGGGCFRVDVPVELPAVAPPVVQDPSTAETTKRERRRTSKG